MNNIHHFITQLVNTYLPNQYISFFKILKREIKEIKGNVLHQIEINGIHFLLQIDKVQLKEELIKRKNENDLLESSSLYSTMQMDVEDEYYQLNQLDDCVNPEDKLMESLASLFQQKMIDIVINDITFEIELESIKKDKSLSLHLDIQSINLTRRNEEDNQLVLNAHGITLYLKQNGRKIDLISIGNEIIGNCSLINFSDYLLHLLMGTKYHGELIILNISEITCNVSFELLDIVESFPKDFNDLLDILLYSQSIEQTEESPETLQKEMKESSNEIQEENEKKQQSNGFFNAFGKVIEGFFNYILPSEEEVRQREEQRRLLKKQQREERKRIERERKQLQKEKDNKIQLTIDPIHIHLIIGTKENGISFDTIVSSQSLLKKQFAISSFSLLISGKELFSVCHSDSTHYFIWTQETNGMFTIQCNGKIVLKVDCDYLETQQEVLGMLKQKITDIIDIGIELLNQFIPKDQDHNKYQKEIQEENNQSFHWKVILHVIHCDMYLIHQKETRIIHIENRQNENHQPLVSIQKENEDISLLIDSELVIIEYNKKQSELKNIHVEIRKGNEMNIIENTYLSLFTKINQKERFGNVSFENTSFTPVIEAFPYFNDDQIHILQKYFMTSELIICFSIDEIKVQIDVDDITFLLSLKDKLVSLVSLLISSSSKNIEETKRNGNQNEELHQEKTKQQEIDDINENDININQIYKILKHQHQIVNDRYFIGKINSIEMKLYDKDEYIQLEINSLSLHIPQNIVGLGLNFCYFRMEQMKISINYLPRSFDGNTYTNEIRDLFLMKQFSLCFLYHSIQTEKRYEDERINHFIEYFMPRNMKEALCIQSKYINISLIYSFEEVKKCISILTSLFPQSNIQHSMNERKEIEDDSTYSFCHTFFNIKTLTINFIPLPNMRIVETMKIPIQTTKCCGHFQMKDNQFICQIGIQMNLNGIILDTNVTIEKMHQIKIRIPKIDIQGEVRVEELSQLINTLMIILTLSNPYEQSTGRSTIECNGFDLSDMIQDDYCLQKEEKDSNPYGKVSIDLSNNIIDIDSYINRDCASTTEEIDGITKKKKRMDFIDKTNEYFNQQSVLETKEMKEDKTISQVVSKSIIEMNIENITINMIIQNRGKYDYLKVESNNNTITFNMSENKQMKGKAIIGKSMIFSSLEKEAIIQLNSESEYSKTIITFETLQMKSKKQIQLNGERENGCDIGIYNESNNLIIRLTPKVMKQFYTMMNPLPHDQKLPIPQFIQEITAPALKLNIFSIEIEPFYAKIKIDGLIDLFKKSIKLPSTPIIIEQLSGDIGEILSDLISRIKDTTLDKIYPFLLWLLSGFFPQFRYLSSIKSFIQSFFI